jgi:hypothetical protein
VALARLESLLADANAASPPDDGLVVRLRGDASWRCGIAAMARCGRQVAAPGTKAADPTSARR